MDLRTVPLTHHVEYSEAEVYEGIDDQALGDGAHVFPQGLADRGLRSIAVKVHVKDVPKEPLQTTACNTSIMTK